MKGLWLGFKSIISIKNSSKIVIISELKDPNGNLSTYPFVIANTINRLFVNVPHEVTKNMPRPTKSPLHQMG